MSRPKLTPLAALMPQKGTATRAEQVIERAREQESKRARNLASDQAFSEISDQMVADPRPVNTASSELARELANPQARESASEQPSEEVISLARDLASGRVGTRVSGPTSERVSKVTDPDDPAEFIDGPRSSVSFRMTERLKDRLRDYAHFSRRQKQDVMDQAVHEFLKKEGY